MYKIKYYKYENIYWVCNKYSHKRHKDNNKIGTSEYRLQLYSMKKVKLTKNIDNMNKVSNNEFKDNRYFLDIDKNIMKLTLLENIN